jgi:hypothetical protein
MTRAEQAAEKVKKHREKLDAMQKAFEARMAGAKEEKRKAEAMQRAEDRKMNTAQRAQWGELADKAGLFTWSTSDFAAVCGVLGRYLLVPNPAAVLEGVLRDKRESSNGVSRSIDPGKVETAPAAPTAITVG